MEDVARIPAESVLIFLCYYEDAASIIGDLTLDYFGSRAHREIAEAALNYWREYKEPPREHIRDELYSQLLVGDDRSDLLNRALTRIEQRRAQINPQYVQERIGEFIYEQRLRNAVLEAQAALDSGDISAAQASLARAQQVETRPFDPGILLSDAQAIQSLLDTEDDGYLFPLHIGPLDEFGCAPSRGALFLFMALPGHGKSWFLIHCGKRAIQYHLRVLHITLEMSAKSTITRYLQAVLGLSRETALCMRPRLTVTEGKSYKLEYVESTAKGLNDHLDEVLSKLDFAKWELLIKQFPTRTLTPLQLENYLDVLANRECFHPDVLIVDYADEMAVTNDVLRHGLSENYKLLRKIAGERGIAMITATQANRLGVSKDQSVLTAAHLSEDFSKAHTADVLLTYNRTDQERDLGLARLWIEKNRDAIDRKMVLISQHYMTGQFALSGVLLDDDDHYKAVQMQAQRDLQSEDFDDAPDY